MKIRLLDPVLNGDYIRQVRSEIVTDLGLPIVPGLVEPLQQAVYLGIYPTAGCEAAGMAEAFFLDQLFTRLEEYSPARELNFAEIASFEEISLIRSIYVAPPWRVRRPVYADLYLAMAYIFHRLGAKVAVMATDSSRQDLANLYLKTGGRMIGRASVPSAPDQPMSWQVFHLPTLLTSPRAKRAIQALEWDSERLRQIRDLKSYQ